MALALGVHQKDKIYIGDIPVTVVFLREYVSAAVEVKGNIIGLSDEKMTEILPSVFMSCGKPSARSLELHAEELKAVSAEWKRRREAVEKGEITAEQCLDLPPVETPYDLLPRLLIEAPKSIVILREELYLRQKCT